MADQGSNVRRLPRWVKIFAVVGALIVVLLVVALLAGHGPGRHGG